MCGEDIVVEKTESTKQSRKWTPERINELALEIAKEVDDEGWVRIKYKIESVLRKYL